MTYNVFGGTLNPTILLLGNAASQLQRCCQQHPTPLAADATVYIRCSAALSADVIFNYLLTPWTEHCCQCKQQLIVQSGMHDSRTIGLQTTSCTYCTTACGIGWV